MHPAFGGPDVVGEAVEPLVVAGVPLQRHLDLGVFLLLLEEDDPLVQRLLRLVEVLHEVADPAAVLVGHFERAVLRPLVTEVDLETLGEEGHLLETRQQRLGPELGLLEDRPVGPERDRRALLAGAAEALQRRHRPAAVDEGHEEPAAVAVDLQLEPDGEGVDHRHAHAVEAAGDLVALAAELAAGVERGEHDLGRRRAGILGVFVDRNATAVVDHPAPAVLQEGDLDLVGVAGHGLVDGVVDDLVDEVMQTAGAGRTDVHPGAFPDGLEALQDGDVLRRVSHARTFRSKWGVGGPRSGENAGQGPEIQRCHLTRRGARTDPENGLSGPVGGTFSGVSARAVTGGDAASRSAVSRPSASPPSTARTGRTRPRNGSRLGELQPRLPQECPAAPEPSSPG